MDIVVVCCRGINRVLVVVPSLFLLLSFIATHCGSCCCLWFRHCHCSCLCCVVTATFVFVRSLLLPPAVVVIVVFSVVAAAVSVSLLMLFRFHCRSQFVAV